MTGTAGREESAAAQGARWIAIAMVVVGLLNYGYALLLTHLLNVTAYSRFAAGQGLILWASTVAVVSVPWVLTKTLVRAQSDEERNAGVRFAKLVSAGCGAAAAFIVGVIATRFADIETAGSLSLSIFVIFLGTTTTGWLQGRERMRTLSFLTIAENLVKNGAGLILVVALGQGDAGALGAFGIGATVLLLRWPRTPHGDGRAWRAALANRDLWRRSIAIAGVQGLVSLFVAIDVVVVALLPVARAQAASYQASAALSRIPLYVAGAVALAFFPSLSRNAGGKIIVARAVRMYLVIALPLAIILATVPSSILGLFFPGQYASVPLFLKYTAITGLTMGGVTLITALFQAADDYSMLRWLAAGLGVYVTALMTGWRVAGMPGLAAGSAVGGILSLALTGYHLVRYRGREVFFLVPLIEPAVAITVLVLLRPFRWFWLVAAVLIGLRAAKHFVRPGARHARGPRWIAALARSSAEDPVLALLTGTVWREAPLRGAEAELHRALDLARQNRVEGRLARAFPRQLAGVLAEVRAADGLIRHCIQHAVERLDRAGIPVVVIPAGAPGEHALTRADLIVSEEHWSRALACLAGWSVVGSVHRLGQSRTALLNLSAGPELYLHGDISWFGVPLLTARCLLDRACPTHHGLLVPALADQLRLQLAQALFRNLVLDLAGLLEVTRMLREDIIADARAEALLEGWSSGFDDALAAVFAAIDRLDRGLPVTLPVPLPLSPPPGVWAARADQHPVTEPVPVRNPKPLRIPAAAQQEGW